MIFIIHKTTDKPAVAVKNKNKIGKGFQDGLIVGLTFLKGYFSHLLLGDIAYRADDAVNPIFLLIPDGLTSI